MAMVNTGVVGGQQEERSSVDQLLDLAAVVRDDGKYKKRLEELQKIEQRIAEQRKELETKVATHKRQVEADNTKLDQLRAEADAKQGLGAAAQDQANRRIREAEMAEAKAKAALEDVRESEARQAEGIAQAHAKLDARDVALSQSETHVRNRADDLDLKEAELKKLSEALARKEEALKVRQDRLDAASSAISKAMSA